MANDPVTAIAMNDLAAWLDFYCPTFRRAVLVIETADNIHTARLSREGQPVEWSELPLLRRAVETLEGMRRGEIPMLASQRTARKRKEEGS